MHRQYDTFRGVQHHNHQTPSTLAACRLVTSGPERLAEQAVSCEATKGLPVGMSQGIQSVESPHLSLFQFIPIMLHEFGTCDWSPRTHSGYLEHTTMVSRIILASPSPCRHCSIISPHWSLRCNSYVQHGMQWGG
jgi:hypothetical protein